MWIDIASIVLACVTANHLGLVKAIEGVFKIKLHVINCPKCSTFWLTLAYGMWLVGFSDIPQLLAVSLLASYTAIWLELLEGYIDTLYTKLYEKIYPYASDDTTAADADNGDSAGSVS